MSPDYSDSYAYAERTLESGVEVSMVVGKSWSVYVPALDESVRGEIKNGQLVGFTTKLSQAGQKLAVKQDEASARQGYDLARIVVMIEGLAPVEYFPVAPEGTPASVIKVGTIMLLSAIA